MPDAAERDAATPEGHSEASADIDAIRHEGLTGRQLRMARPVAQKNGMSVTSDFDAMRQLRLAGVDPFQRSTVLKLVASDSKSTGGTRAPGSALGAIPDMPGMPKAHAHQPQTIADTPDNLPATEFARPADRHLSEIMKIQSDLGRRRRRQTALMMTRLAIFVLLPTLMVRYYFYNVATPMYSTNSEFIIQQAEPATAAGGLGGLFQGTSMAIQQDSITVQSYLSSGAAMVRLDEEHNFKDTFSDPNIDPVQRLAEGGTNEAAFSIYQNRVKISCDPTEGILKMDVIAPSPAANQEISEALIGYAEEQVDQLSQRLREDQMAGALESYEAAEVKRSSALAA